MEVERNQNCSEGAVGKRREGDVVGREKRFKSEVGGRIYSNGIVASPPSHSAQTLPTTFLKAGSSNFRQPQVLLSRLNVRASTIVTSLLYPCRITEC